MGYLVPGEDVGEMGWPLDQKEGVELPGKDALEAGWSLAPGGLASRHKGKVAGNYLERMQEMWVGPWKQGKGVGNYLERMRGCRKSGLGYGPRERW
jgi:hypothetical protein